MEIISILEDKKVKSKNIQFTIDISSYVEIAKKILDNNPYQRKKLNKSGSIYNLLKEDILKGCIIPPIVLASSSSEVFDNKDYSNEIYSIMSDYKNLKILDGLQRTYSLIDVYDSNKVFFDSQLEKYKIRAEVYISINETGVLYRMLTLNTGQTPMTLRHQLEILYSKYTESNIDGIYLIKETDDEKIDSINKLKFSDAIEGFNSFLEKTEFPIDRINILETVKTLDFISSEDSSSSLFPDFIKSYHRIIYEFNKKFDDWSYPNEDEEIPQEYKIDANPYGRNIIRIFNKSQTITGYGAALGLLLDMKMINSIKEIDTISASIIFEDDDLLYMTKVLDEIRKKSRKVGNGQRMFFKFFFQNFLNKETAFYRNVKSSIERAYNRTSVEV